MSRHVDAAVPAAAAALFLGAVFLGCTSGTTGKKDPGSPTASPTAAPCGGDGNLCVVAGQAGFAGSEGDGGPATQARLYWPQDAYCLPDGTVYVADWNNHKIRRVDADGTITRLFGTGVSNDTCNVAAAQVELNHPTDYVRAADGTFYLAAWHNQKIKRFDPVANLLTCPIGSTPGFSGDGGPASAAQFNLPSSVVFDPAGNLYISDQGNQRIRRVDTQSPPVVTTIAGNGGKGFSDGCGTAATFSFPAGQNAQPGGKIAISLDASYLYCADTDNHRIRRIELSNGCVTTIAGGGAPGYSGDGGPASAATLNTPQDVAVGPDGSLYVADAKNHVVRRIATGGVIATVAGTGTPGSSPDGTPARQAMLNLPCGVFVTGGNVLYIADTYNQQIKKVQNP